MAWIEALSEIVRNHGFVWVEILQLWYLYKQLVEYIYTYRYHHGAVYKLKGKRELHHVSALSSERCFRYSSLLAF